MLYAVFQDAIRERDCTRVLSCWKFFLLIFKPARQKNYMYDIEAMKLLSQYHLQLPDCLAQQLLWFRFVNTHGKPGCNIPCDLYLEHCNRVCNIAIRGIGANLMPKALQRIDKCSGPLLKIIEHLTQRVESVWFLLGSPYHPSRKI